MNFKLEENCKAKDYLAHLCFGMDLTLNSLSYNFGVFIFKKKLSLIKSLNSWETSLIADLSTCFLFNSYVTLMPTDGRWRWTFYQLWLTSFSNWFKIQRYLPSVGVNVTSEYCSKNQRFSCIVHSSFFSKLLQTQNFCFLDKIRVK